MDIRNDMSKDEVKKFIKEMKRELEDYVTIPAHHYQTQEVVNFSDFVGDSYKLAKDCSKLDAKFIIFCGVKFMAEGAAILATDKQKVIIPDTKAGCPLADKINADQLKKAYNKISKKINKELMPVVYVNSSAEAKSFCGKYGGATCTSSSANEIIQYYLDKGNAVFFAPDYNLGINTADKMGLEAEHFVKVKRDFSLKPDENLENAKLFAWDGFCHVHKKFTIDQIKKLRKEYEEINIIVHPESDREVVQKSDYSGSTQQILKKIEKAKKGSVWGVGTEYHFVKRLDDLFKDKKVIPLKKAVCTDMTKIDLYDLAQSLQSVKNYLEAESKLPNVVEIPAEIQKNAGKALRKMIEIREA
ncbi:MAG: quinolinate synthase NadA [Candidatus Cloacimonetes bacterium]|nr:quinolinate synthase NadA [Candidatus Cloacimonadota bacterium]